MEKDKGFFSQHRYLQFTLVLIIAVIIYAFVCKGLYCLKRIPSSFQWETYSNSVITTVSILVGFSASSFGVFFGISNQEALKRIVGYREPRRQILFTLFVPVILGMATIGCAMLVQIVGEGAEKIAIQWLIGLTGMLIMFLVSFVFSTYRTFAIICAAIAKKE